MILKCCSKDQYIPYLGRICLGIQSGSTSILDCQLRSFVQMRLRLQPKKAEIKVGSEKNGSLLETHYPELLLKLQNN